MVTRSSHQVSQQVKTDINWYIDNLSLAGVREVTSMMNKTWLSDFREAGDWCSWSLYTSVTHLK